MATVKIEVTKERRSDMLCGALEGGSNYWYLLKEKACKIIQKYGKKGTPTVDRMFEAIYAGETIEIHDAEDEKNKLGEINLTSMDKGEQTMANKQPRHFMDMINEEDDAITADVWFQYCVMNDLVFG